MIDSPTSRGKLIQVLVEVAKEGCREGWLDEAVLTARSSHDEALGQDSSSLCPRFEHVFAGCQERQDRAKPVHRQ